MAAAVDWFRREMAQAEQRASGRVTPALLDPIRVELKDVSGHKYRLEEVATVGVRDGSMLVVTAFDSSNLKSIEAAIYDAKIPGIVPQRADERTVRIPIPKPTVEARQAQYAAAARTAEDTRSQMRRHFDASIKKGGYNKRSAEHEAFHKLLEDHIAEVNASLASLKKATGGK
ncbi:ribosome recycling factor domain-containing protein [Vararia minispora EC-137]|uniref:Ribosome recycling factor domain-containing protein n=1 Tax=Vararia minispora EC-137 TaxID=1314806 RepID=A0ACB8QL78_9AGAM|nr:ribosome recycling factor domain-containing protein [Vararia minispora EC-137]